MSPIPVDRPYGPTTEGGWTPYRIDGCPKNSEPALLVVTDAWQAQLDVFTRRPISPVLITVEEIRADILLQWTSQRLRGAPPGAGPGIWGCAKETPARAEIQAALERQTVYFEWLFYEAQRSWQDRDWKNITEEHRMAALWLGKEEAWVKKLAYDDIKYCPACRSEVHPEAFLCKVCGFLLREMDADMLARFQNAQAQPQTRSQRGR